MAMLPVALFSALLIYLGQRLVRSGLRSGGAELWLGLSFLPAGFGTVTLFCVATGVDLGAPPARVNLAAQGLMHFGAVAFAAFVWRTFRHGDAWARRFFQGVCVWYLLLTVLYEWTGASAAQSHPFHIVMSASQAVVFGWGFVEALVFHRSMRRRSALGLADPVVANRFVLFGLWTGSMSLLPLIVMGLRVFLLLTGASDPAAEDAAGTVVREGNRWALDLIRGTLALLGLPMMSGIWLTFFPPTRYTQWIEARAGAGA